jgi:hypothetical protein
MREEVCTKLEIGMSKGETELDIVTRLIWLERKNTADAIEKAVAAALESERRRKAEVLDQKSPLCSRAPS